LARSLVWAADAEFFDTIVAARVKRFDADALDRSGNKEIGSVQLPEALFTAMLRRLAFRVAAPMAARVAFGARITDI